MFEGGDSETWDPIFPPSLDIADWLGRPLVQAEQDLGTWLEKLSRTDQIRLYLHSLTLILAAVGTGYWGGEIEKQHEEGKRLRRTLQDC